MYLSFVHGETSSVLLFKLCVSFTFMNVCFVSLFATFVPHPWRSEEGIRSPGTGGTGGLEPLCGCWKSNLAPLQKQPGLAISEPPLQPTILYIVSHPEQGLYGA